MKLDEEQLVAQCRKNDQRACRKLYDMFAPSMFSLCIRYVGDRVVAQDVLHDGFVKVFANLGNLRATDSLKSWVTSIMIHTALNALRTVKPIESIENYDNDAFSDDEFNASIQTYDIELIHQAIQQLPEFARIVFNMHEIEGYSYEEISQRYSVKPATIRSIIFRSRKQVIDRINKLGLA